MRAGACPCLLQLLVMSWVADEEGDMGGDRQDSGPWLVQLLGMSLMADEVMGQKHTPDFSVSWKVIVDRVGNTCQAAPQHVTVLVIS